MLFLEIHRNLMLFLRSVVSRCLFCFILEIAELKKTFCSLHHFMKCYIIFQHKPFKKKNIFHCRINAENLEIY